MSAEPAVAILAPSAVEAIEEALHQAVRNPLYRLHAAEHRITALEGLIRKIDPGADGVIKDAAVARAQSGVDLAVEKSQRIASAATRAARLRGEPALPAPEPGAPATELGALELLGRDRCDELIKGNIAAFSKWEQSGDRRLDALAQVVFHNAFLSLLAKSIREVQYEQLDARLAAIEAALSE